MRFWIAGVVLMCLSIVPTRVEGQAVNGVEKCGTEQVDAIRRANDPRLGSRAELEAWLQRGIAQRSRSGARATLVTLPVIMHIIHDGEPVGDGRNVSQAQVQSQLDVLNEDFRRLMGTPGFNNHPAGADVEIEFCAARIDTNGNVLAEPGIDRIDRNARSWAEFSYTSSYIETTVKPESFWDPDRYLNIWVIDHTYLGYAQLPNNSSLDGIPNYDGDAPTDGVVINPTNFGRTGSALSPYDGGRTLTHELGHWLGLIHIWGDGDCTLDDECADTPDAGEETFGCPTDPQSCGGRKMMENYMDYTDDACMNIFTLCQKGRIRTVLDSADRRGILAMSDACNLVSGVSGDLFPGLEVFPNPSEGSFVLQLEECECRDLRLEVIGQDGRLIRSEFMLLVGKSLFHEIDLSNEAPGIYLLRLIAGEGISTRRLLLLP